MSDQQRKTLRIIALSAASGRQITEEQVREIAESRDLIKPDGTISLIEYTALLARDV